MKTQFSPASILSSIPAYLVILLSFLYLVLFWGLFPYPEYTSFFTNPWSWFTGLLREFNEGFPARIIGQLCDQDRL